MMSPQTPTREVGSEEMGENEEEWMTPIIVKKDEIILAQKGLENDLCFRYTAVLVDHQDVVL